jgi:peptidoglycan endopeptidase LytE
MNTLPPIGATDLVGTDTSNQTGITGGMDASPSTPAPSPAGLAGASPGGTAALPAATTPVTPSVPEGNTHKIVSGDTLAALATHYHVPLKELLAANPKVNPKRLQINETIVIPTAAAAAAPGSTSSFGTTTPTLDTADTATYKVKAGDNLSKIAKDHGTSVKAIQSLNGMKTTAIRAGQTLKMPAKAHAAPAAEAASTASTAATSPSASLTPVGTASVR